MPVDKKCVNCGCDYKVIPSKARASKYCSRECSRAYQGHSSDPNVTCTFCGKAFHMKPFQMRRYKRKYGYLCSATCHAKLKSQIYQFDGNPNWKGRNVDAEGYKLYTPAAQHCYGMRRMKLHQAVCCQELGIERMPKGVTIHHRDCNVMNNEPYNLAVLTNSDHKWLHHQFGVASLRAMMRGDITPYDLSKWSDDPTRAEYLLMLNVEMQSVVTKTLNISILQVVRMKPVTDIEIIEVEKFTNETEEGDLL